MKKDNIYILILISFFLILFAIRFWRVRQLKNSAFTVTTTVREFRTLKNGRRIEHFYYVNGKKYENDYIINTYKKIKVPSGKYLVKYSINYPDISEVLWEARIPDSLKHLLK